MSVVPYINWLRHGAVSLAPPAVFTDAKAHLFTIQASTSAIQKLTDTLLNPAGGGVVRYEAVLPVAMFSFMDIAKCTSAADVMGWLPGRECAIWVPLLETHPGYPLRTRLVFWAPYIFIDYDIGMITGREIWGWPKVGAQIQVGSDHPGAAVFSCTTTYFSTMAAETRGERGVLYQVARLNATPQPDASSWQSGSEARQGLIGSVLGGVANDVLDLLGLHPHVPSVVLKQVRAAAAPGSACFRALVDSPVEITKFTGGGALLDTFVLDVTTCESHQIVADLLGRAPDPGHTRLPVRFAAWLTVDFQALPGTDIVVA